MRLLDPFRLGPSGQVVAPSRVVFGPHETNLGRKRALSDRHVAYYARRAAGGAGIVVTEEASVHRSDWPYERCPLAADCGPGWAAVAAAVAAAGTGTVVLAAIGHSGGQGATAYSQAPLWAPSPVPEVATREVPKVMEIADIAAVVDGFAAATRLAVASGMHGVEVNAGQFSLVRQFLSGLTNQREDEYGADRSRFAREVLAAVRAAAGDAVVALRLSVDELAPWAGIVPEAGAALAVELAPYVDLVTVVRGSIFSAAATRPDGHVEPGFGIDLARQVRAALRAAGSSVPVVAQGSIVDPGQAEWALASEAADAVEMTRAQLADASLVAKLRAGAADRVRPCILCNQACKVRDNRNPIVSCVVDPATGHETEDEPVPSAPSPGGHGRVVTVVGGGVAGLEAARVAALRGLSVRVLERSARVGGAVPVAAAGAGRARLAAIVDWLAGECERLGVTAETGVSVDAAALGELAAAGPVIVATGGQDGVLPFPVSAGAVVHHAAAVLADPAGTLPAEGPIVVWDPIGGPIGISVAELLAGAGRSVTLVTPDLLVGEKLSLSGDLAPAQVRLHGAGVRLVTRALVRSVGPDGVLVEDRFGAGTSVLPAAAVVAAGHRLPAEPLVDPLPAHVLVAGDAVAPRTILEAILEGRRAALAVH